MTKEEKKINKLTVLIVEDELHIRFVLTKILEDYFKTILTATDGIEALGIIEKNDNIACVLSDLEMPNMNGISLIREVRKQKNNIPFIFFTAYGSTNHMLDAIKYGAFDFVEKPNFDNLEMTVARAVRSNFKVEKTERNEDDFMTKYQEMLNNIK